MRGERLELVCDVADELYAASLLAMLQHVLHDVVAELVTHERLAAARDLLQDG